MNTVMKQWCFDVRVYSLLSVKNKGTFTLLLLLIESFNLRAQTPEYFGAGYTTGVSISSSPSLGDTIWKTNPIPENTMNGSGLDSDYFEASRFLLQSTLGFNESYVNDVLNNGMESWLDSQSNLAIDSIYLRMYQNVQIVRESC